MISARNKEQQKCRVGLFDRGSGQAPCRSVVGTSMDVGLTVGKPDPKTGAACGLQSKLRLTRLALVWLF
jgi:hypothetical protein